MKSSPLCIAPTAMSHCCCMLTRNSAMFARLLHSHVMTHLAVQWIHELAWLMFALDSVHSSWSPVCSMWVLEHCVYFTHFPSVRRQVLHEVSLEHYNVKWHTRLLLLCCHVCACFNSLFVTTACIAHTVQMHQTMFFLHIAHCSS